MPVQPFPNLATDARISVSSTFIAPDNASVAKVSHLNDGDGRTYWASEYKDPQWIQLDFGAIRDIGQITLLWENASAKAYAVSASLDGKKWRTLHSVKNGAPGARTETIALPHGTRAQALKVDLKERATGWGYAIFEIIIAPSKAPNASPAKNR